MSRLRWGYLDNFPTGSNNDSINNLSRPYELPIMALQSVQMGVISVDVPKKIR